ncbi:helix-turn-helix domain-containing protein [Streptomyces sp. KM273126]|uniref:helix-turn-helix domain-containing protein n=1 Tax=Streptomyces sp. KM273126 TaxID=2545247 RepID=UPI00215D71D6|nr:helix-turn-helix domain-containing protein [Streptomyces sp. KM273126]
MEHMDRKALAEFLRRRRETLRPRDVGMAEGPRRRTQGLRREEVAALAGMSTDLLHPAGTAARPSVQIAAALARAMRLSPGGRELPGPLGRQRADRGTEAHRLTPVAPMLLS